MTVTVMTVTVTTVTPTVGEVTDLMGLMGPLVAEVRVMGVAAAVRHTHTQGGRRDRHPAGWSRSGCRQFLAVQSSVPCQASRDV